MYEYTPCSFMAQTNTSYLKVQHYCAPCVPVHHRTLYYSKQCGWKKHMAIRKCLVAIRTMLFMLMVALMLRRHPCFITSEVLRWRTGRSDIMMSFLWHQVTMQLINQSCNAFTYPSHCFEIFRNLHCIVYWSSLPVVEQSQWFYGVFRFWEKANNLFRLLCSVCTLCAVHICVIFVFLLFSCIWYRK